MEYCSQWFKDTNLKANHNWWGILYYWFAIVPNGSKILIWKQITTQWKESPAMVDCSQWFKDTNLKANHNWWGILYYWFAIVPNGSKILIWKQITTQWKESPAMVDCSQWFKDTNLKANHNCMRIYNHLRILFPMVQRY